MDPIGMVNYAERKAVESWNCVEKFDRPPKEGDRVEHRRGSCQDGHPSDVLGLTFPYERDTGQGEASSA